MTGRQDLFQQAMNRGHSAAWDQDWETAAANYRAALVEFPDHPKALTSLGLALLSLKQVAEAADCYQRAARALPEDPLPMEKLAQAYEALNRPGEAVTAALRAAELHARKNELERAVEQWLRVVRLQPDHLAAHSRLALAYEKLDRKPQAVHEYLAIAGLLQHGGDQAKAEQAVRRALQLQPESVEARKSLIALARRQNLPRPSQLGQHGSGARQQPERPATTTIQPTSEGDPITEARQVAIAQLAEALFEQTEVRDSARPARIGMDAILRGGEEISPESEQRDALILYLGQAIQNHSRGQDAAAVEGFEKAQEAGFQHPAAWFLIGLLRLRLGEPDLAARALQEAVYDPTYTLAAHLLLARALRQAGRPNLAAQECLEALRVADLTTVDEADREIVYQLYEPLMEEQRQEADPDKLEALCKSVQGVLMRSDWRAYILKARQEMPRGGSGAPMLPLAEMVMQTNSGQVVEMIGAVRRLAEQGFRETAVEEAYHALQFAPTYLPLHMQIGELLLEADQVETAKEKFSVVAQVHVARGEVQQAANVLRRVKQLAPMDMRVRRQLIDLLVARGQTSDAVTETLELAELHYRLADLDTAAEAYTAALALARPVEALRPQQAEISFRLADLHLQRLELRPALQLFEQIRDLHPADERARTHIIDLNLRLGQVPAAVAEVDNYLAYLESQGKGEQAIAVLTTLLEERPDSLELRSRLADRYRRAGMNSKAVTEYDRLADELLNQGKTEEAARAIRQILSLNPPEAAHYNELLRQISE